MHEDPYTGSPVEDFTDLLPPDGSIIEFDPDDDALADEYASLADTEQVIAFLQIADGATSLVEAAKRLYDYADELITMSDEGWEIVDNVANGYATAVQFGAFADEDV